MYYRYLHRAYPNDPLITHFKCTSLSTAPSHQSKNGTGKRSHRHQRWQPRLFSQRRNRAFTTIIGTIRAGEADADMADPVVLHHNDIHSIRHIPSPRPRVSHSVFVLPFPTQLTCLGTIVCSTNKMVTTDMLL